jgi:hypothetical protein
MASQATLSRKTPQKSALAAAAMQRAIHSDYTTPTSPHNLTNHLRRHLRPHNHKRARKAKITAKFGEERASAAQALRDLKNLTKLAIPRTRTLKEQGRQGSLQNLVRSAPQSLLERFGVTSWIYTSQTTPFLMPRLPIPPPFTPTRQQCLFVR